MTARFGRKSGLSLLELLVSLSMLALIGAGLAGAFELGTQIWSRTSALGEHRQEIELRRQLRRYMTQAMPPSRTAAIGRPFSGSKDGLSFLTLAPTPFAPNASAMRLALSVQDDGLQLTTEMIDEDGAIIGSWSDVLVQEADQISLQYWSSAAEPPGWQSEWTNTTQLPELIRISVSEGSKPSWPEFVVRPLLQ